MAAPGVAAVQPPAGQWRKALKQWYEALAESGQAQFYQAGDWASAWLIADAMNAELKADGSIKSATLAVWKAINAELLATEGARRRAAIELQRSKPVEAVSDVSRIDDYRRRLESS